MVLTVTCRAQGKSAGLGKCQLNLRQPSRVPRIKDVIYLRLRSSNTH